MVVYKGAWVWVSAWTGLRLPPQVNFQTLLDQAVQSLGDSVIPATVAKELLKQPSTLLLVRCEMLRLRVRQSQQNV